MNYKKLALCFLLIAALLLNSYSVFAATNKAYITISEVSPINKSDGISTDISIIIKFKCQIYKGIKSLNISLINSNKKAVPISSVIKGNSLIIKPKSNMDYGMTYILTIPVNSIKDSNGNSLAKNYIMQFTTKKKEGQKPVTSLTQTAGSSTDNSDLVISGNNQPLFIGAKISPNIKSLHFVNCNITTLDLTKGCENLTSLEIKNSPITSVDLSNGLDKLTTLSIIDSPITCLNIQPSLTNLTTFNLVNSPVASMRNLNIYISLKKLDLSRSYFTNLDQLSGLTNLTDLNLSGNGIDNIDALKRLTNLVSLNLSNNAITNIEALKHLTKLRTLSLSNNDIADFSPVSSYYNNLIQPDFTLTPGQTQQETAPSVQAPAVIKGAWTTLNNWPYNGKLDNLILTNREQGFIRVLPSNDMGKTAVVGDKIYLIECDGNVKEYNPSTDSWVSKKQIDALKGTLRFFKLTTINKKIYIVGANFSDILEYDPATNECIFKTKLPSKRVVGAVTTLNGKIYLFGGYDYTDASILSSVDEYDPLSNKWVKKKDMPHGAHDLRVASLNGKMYTLWIRPSSIVDGNGGVKTDFEGCEVFYVDSQDLVEYDPIADNWTIKAQANYLRTDAELEVENGKIIVLGEGFEKNVKFPKRKRYETIEEYDPAHNTWAKKGDMTGALIRWYGTASYNNEIYLFDSGNVLKYSPAIDNN